jgi:enoyl-CoA hydratase
MVTGVRYERSGAVSTITMDDGKVNALSTDMLQELNAALDQAEVDDAIVVLTGRDGVFSAGFDLAVLAGDGGAAIPMLRAGFELAHRVLSSRRPVIVACSGHAIAMGAFLLLSADYRIGVAGAAHKYTANEVAIGLTMPHAAIAICRPALTPAAFRRAMELAAVFTPEAALDAGFVDDLVQPGMLLTRAQEHALQLGELNVEAHAATKRRTRRAALIELRDAIETDAADFRATTPHADGDARSERDGADADAAPPGSGRPR